MIRNRDRINSLHPRFAQYIEFYLAYADALGLEPVVVEAFRTAERQDWLYAQGRTRAGTIVTKAKAGQSAHNYGLAVDVTSAFGWDSRQAKELHRLAEWLGFGTIAWDTPHVEWPGWRGVIKPR